MTLQEVKLLHAYNSWASKRLFDALEPLPTDQYLRDMKASHTSIHGTMTHIVGAQKMWLSRWLGMPDKAFTTTADVPGLAELKGLWETVGFDTAKFLGTLTDRKLLETVTMTTSKGEKHLHILWQTFQHLVDHSSFHRGQVVVLLRQLDVQPPATGLIGFYREIGKLEKG